MLFQIALKLRQEFEDNGRLRYARRDGRLGYWRLYGGQHGGDPGFEAAAVADLLAPSTQHRQARPPVDKAHEFRT